MARRGRKPKAPPKPKRVSYELLSPKAEPGKAMYVMLNELIEEYHEELTNARIALAWNKSWKPDVDGRVKLGKCKKASDLDRELADFDFVVILRAEFWQSPSVTDAQRRALLDHELCHATVKEQADGEPARDERDRVIYRVRKHDIEEFSQIVERHGLYKRDLELFAGAIRRSQQGNLPLGDEADEKNKRPPSKEQAAAALSNVAGRSLAEQFIEIVRGTTLDAHELERAFTTFAADKGIRGDKRKELRAEVERLRSGNGNGKPLPTEPHPFVGKRGRGDAECATCGSSPHDEVHTGQGQAPAAEARA